MGKRSSFERNPRDFYPTPPEAVTPLMPHVPRDVWFIEPCAGDGALIRALEAAGHKCVAACDTEPQTIRASRGDARTAQFLPNTFDYFVTNPPWSRDVLHPIIENLVRQGPTWLLLDADWMHTKQAAPYLTHCATIVSVGRVKWIPGSKMTGKDNCAWYLFHRGAEETTFVGRSV